MRERPRGGRWLKRPQKPRTWLKTLYWTIHAPCVLVRVATQTSPERRWIYLLSNRVLIGLWVLGCVVYLLNELRLRRLRRIDEALTERPEGLVEYPVEAIIYVNDRPTGLDRGVVYFEDGLMGYVGSSFSFLLAATDFEQKPVLQREIFTPKLTLRGMNAQVAVRPLIGYGRAYRASLKQFLEEAKPVAGERQWPPLSDYVEAAPESLSAQTEEELTPLKVSL